MAERLTRRPGPARRSPRAAKVVCLFAWFSHVGRGTRSLLARLIALVAALVGALSLVAACSSRNNASAAGQQATRQVKVEAAELRDVRRAVDVVGTLSARED